VLRSFASIQVVASHIAGIHIVNSHIVNRIIADRHIVNICNIGIGDINLTKPNQTVCVGYHLPSAVGCKAGSRSSRLQS
jgi:hypothetical protein